MANAMFGPDGTADPPPSPSYPDPLAGLMGAGALAAPMGPTDAVPHVRAAKPIEIDHEQVRAEVQRALSDDGDGEDREPGAAERASWQPPSVPGTPASGASARTYRQSRPAARQGRSSTGQASGNNRSPGCVIMVVLIVIVILFNVFSRLGDWVSDLFH